MPLAFASDIPFVPYRRKIGNTALSAPPFCNDLGIGNHLVIKKRLPFARPEGEFGSTRPPGFTLCESVLDGAPSRLSPNIPQIPGNVITDPSHQIPKSPRAFSWRFTCDFKAFPKAAITWPVCRRPNDDISPDGHLSERARRDLLCRTCSA